MKEIPFPLPDIKGNYLRKRKPKIRKIDEKKVDYIRFERDPSLVSELAELCKISEDLALELLTVFFDEIKQNLLTGNIVYFDAFAKIYLACSNFKKNTIVENEIRGTRRFCPKIKISRVLKRQLAKLYKNPDVENPKDEESVE